LCDVSALEAELLTSRERPIVLLAKRRVGALSDSVAPGSRYLGVMLPYTPLHHLLLRAAGRPLVMTSGNRSDEPIVYENRDACTRLAGVADRFLLHDRPIRTRCDDSVVRRMSDGPSFIRRSRGWAPRPIAVAGRFAAPVLGLGAQLKSTFCLAKGNRAFLSQHVGDLDCPDTFRALGSAVAHYVGLFDARPEIVAHDLHPDYLSTRLAEEMNGVERVAVQHHHAHVAACMAEHRVTEPVLGVVFDGAGLGDDGAIWGGEFLAVGGAGYERMAHLGYVPLPGGDRAAREPWRMAAAHLWAAYSGEVERLEIPFAAVTARPEWPLLRQMLGRGVRCPHTSSVGRLFDAAAALVGLRSESRFEGQAAMELELAADPDVSRAYAVEIGEAGGRLVVDPGPLIRGLVADIAANRSVAEIAGAFHNTVGDLIVQVVERVRERTGLRTVALTGGVFQNRLLTERAQRELSRRGFAVLIHRRVPCNDGGISLGQAAVAGRILTGIATCA
ncbi:MAG: carbamoyltransferase HypF, partial [Gemmatimonadales bacterium]|nr:carbamoyltransferase HypF [Gemmatimonadales bacterium]